MNKIKCKTDTTTLILLYKSFFYPQLNYCNLFFKTNLERINRLQKRVIRLINSNEKKFYYKFNTLKIEDLVTLNTQIH